MYLITALVCTAISAILYFAFKARKGLRLEVLTIIYGASSVMWLIDSIFSASKGEGFFSFEEKDGWIALATLLGGVFLWLMISFILNNKEIKTIKE